MTEGTIWGTTLSLVLSVYVNEYGALFLDSEGLENLARENRQTLDTNESFFRSGILEPFE